MGAIRERPRVVAVQVAAVLVLLVIGFLLGSAAKGDTEPKTPAGVEQRLQRLERTTASQSKELEAEKARADKAEAATRRQARGFKRRLRRAAVREVRFRRALRRARAGN